MGVGSITSMSSMSGIQTTTAARTDVKSKNIQKEIDDAQQQMRKVASQEELTVDEKADERKKLQKEITGLNTELERHQEEFLRAQKRETMMAELRKEAAPAEEEEASGRIRTEEVSQEDDAEKAAKTREGDTKGVSQKETAAAAAGTSARQTGNPGTIVFKDSDGTVILKGEMGPAGQNGVAADQNQAAETGKAIVAKEETDDDEAMEAAGLSHKEMHAMVSADASARQADRQGNVIAGIGGDIAVLKGEMKLDERRGDDTGRKQAELEKLEEKEEKARIFQFSVLGEAGSAMRSSAEDDASGKQVDKENNAVINAARLSQEEQTAQQRFYVSVG